MAKRPDKSGIGYERIEDERIEDTTMYGEFISSFHRWTTPEGQMKKAKYMEEVTKELMPQSKNKH